MLMELNWTELLIWTELIGIDIMWSKLIWTELNMKCSELALTELNWKNLY